MTTHDPDLDGEIENAVVDYIRMIADVTTQAGHGRPEWVYRSAYHLLLALGRFFVPAPRAPGIPKMPDRYCYENASVTANANASDGLLYAEGFATPGAVMGLPLAHAWCVTPDGTVVDPTWQDSGAVYFGIALADSAIQPPYAGGLLSDFEQCLPLLRDGVPATALADIGRRPTGLP
ncbi:hypothetical protein [Nocardia brasiliensis]|uniref:hypothetical protein n=1 Tax=Nocardia brasiliensis TaxID=37326 RepID=UPI0024588C97|nr:hypothetical protein [Nocardia brasiliensis]